MTFETCPVRKVAHRITLLDKAEVSETLYAIGKIIPPERAPVEGINKARI